MHSLAYTLLRGFAIVCVLLNTRLRSVSATSAPYRTGRRQLAENSCYNYDYWFHPTTWNESFVHQTPAKLLLHKVWKPAHHSSLPLTIVTHLNLGRLNQLEAQCQAFQGDFSVAIYLPIVQEEVGLRMDQAGKAEVRGAMEQLQAFHDRVEQAPGCRMTILLVTEVMRNRNVTLLYPYNSLRNAATLQAQTPLVAMIDVDLVPSTNLNDELKDPEKVQRLMDICARKAVVVLPAYELTPPPAPADSGLSESDMEQQQLPQMQQAATETIQGGKPKLVQMWRQGAIRQFHVKSFAPGHLNTRYDHWLDASDYYSATYKWQYEPWFIINRLHNQWYDVRFRAWYYDKVLHLASLVWRDAFEVVVHPSAFLLHRPHSKPKEMRNATIAMDILRWMKPRAGLVAVQAMDGGYKPRIDKYLHRCVHALPWWNQTHNTPGYWSQYAVAYGEPLIPDWV